MNLSGQRVLIFGDSQAQGISRELGRLLTDAGAIVAYSTHVGMSLLQGATLAPPPARADLVIVSFGGNNPPTTYARATQEMDRLLTLLQGARVYWMTVLPSVNPAIEPARAQMAAWQKQYLPSKGVGILDGEQLAAGLPRGIDPHLTGSGYTTLSQRIYAALGGTATPLSGWVGPVIGGLALGAGLAFLVSQRD